MMTGLHGSAPSQPASRVTQYDTAVDIYSAGIILWQVATRKIPYEDVESTFDIEIGVSRGTLRPPVCEFGKPRLCALIQRCWAPRPDKRPTALEVATRLESPLLFDDSAPGADEEADIKEALELKKQQHHLAYGCPLADRPMPFHYASRRREHGSFSFSRSSSTRSTLSTSTSTKGPATARGDAAMKSAGTEAGDGAVVVVGDLSLSTSGAESLESQMKRLDFIQREIDLLRTHRNAQLCIASMVEAMRQPDTGICLANRTFWGRVITDCFVGQQMVDWLMQIAGLPRPKARHVAHSIRVSHSSQLFCARVWLERSREIERERERERGRERERESVCMRVCVCVFACLLSTSVCTRMF